MTISPSFLDQIDKQAAAMGVSRASWINAAIYQALQFGFQGIKGKDRD